MFWRTLLGVSVVLLVAYVVRGRRRGDRPIKILRDSLPIGTPLLLSLAEVVPRLRDIAFVAMWLVVVAMFWNLIRSAPH
jgi:hypothetical protein